MRVDENWDRGGFVCAVGFLVFILLVGVVNCYAAKVL